MDEKELKKYIEYQRKLNSIRNGHGIEGSPMEIIPGLLRGAFRAPDGKKLVAADLSQIELRMLAWITNSKPMLETFANDLDMYISFAASMYNTTYELVTKDERQIAKPAVLSCGYGSGGGKLTYDKNGDELKTGLWGYAADMGINMTREQAWDAVNKYRATYPEVPRMWDEMFDHIVGLMEEGDRTKKVASAAFPIATNSWLYYTYFPGKMLRVMLPSGRWLTYLKPKLTLQSELVGTDDVWRSRPEVTYDGKLGKVIIRERLYGSIAFQHIVQAMSRDAFAVGMVRADEAGFTIVAHTHDELVCLEDLTGHHNLTYLNNMMVSEISWCSDLPLKSDGWEGPVYKK